MNDLKTLIDKARIEIRHAYGEDASDVRLEEYDNDIDEIIVSFLLPDRNPQALPVAMQMMGQRKYERVYKKIQFKDDGEVKSVKIYKPE